MTYDYQLIIPKDSDIQLYNADIVPDDSCCFVLFTGGIDSLHALTLIPTGVSTIYLFTVRGINSKFQSERDLIANISKMLPKGTASVILESYEFDLSLHQHSTKCKYQRLKLPGKIKDQIIFIPKESVVKNLVIAMYAATRMQELNVRGKLYVPFDNDGNSSHYCDRTECFNYFGDFFRKRFNIVMESVGYSESRFSKIKEIISWGGESLYAESAKASCFSRSEIGDRCEKCEKCKANIAVENYYKENKSCAQL